MSTKIRWWTKWLRMEKWLIQQNLGGYLWALVRDLRQLLSNNSTPELRSPPEMKGARWMMGNLSKEESRLMKIQYILESRNCAREIQSEVAGIHNRLVRWCKATSRRLTNNRNISNKSYKCLQIWRSNRMLRMQTWNNTKKSQSEHWKSK